MKLTRDRRTPPHEFLVAAQGPYRTTHGDLIFDRQAAESVMAAWREWGVDLCIDVNHLSLDPARTMSPLEASAALGWFRLELRDGDLWAVDVRWTEKAREYLTSGALRYFSPVFVFDPKTMRIRELVSLALTNTPATKGLSPLISFRYSPWRRSSTSQQLQTGRGTMPLSESEYQSLVDEITKAHADAVVVSPSVAYCRAGGKDYMVPYTYGEGDVVTLSDPIEITIVDAAPEGEEGTAALTAAMAEHERAVLAATRRAEQAEQALQRLEADLRPALLELALSRKVIVPSTKGLYARMPLQDLIALTASAPAAVPTRDTTRRPPAVCDGDVGGKDPLRLTGTELAALKRDHPEEYGRVMTIRTEARRGGARLG